MIIKVNISSSGKVYNKREQDRVKLVDLEIAAQNQKSENIQLGEATAALP